MQSKNIRRRSQTICLIVATILISFSANASPLPQAKGKSVSPATAGTRPGSNIQDMSKAVSTTNELPARQAMKKLEAPTGEPNPARHESIPFRVELGEGISPPQAEVILAVRAVTIFHCPEPPMQVLIGDTTGLGLVESIEGHDRADFYLRPTTVGIHTNMWIEMPSATVHVPIRTVGLKGGAGSGGYNGEVFVRLPGFREKSESVRARAAAIEIELGECIARCEELERRSAEEKRRIKAETETMMADETLALLVGASFTSQTNSKPVRIASAWVKQVGSSVRLGTRRLWAVLEIENRDKQKILWVERLTGPEGYKARTREGRLPPVGPRKRVRVAVMIERIADIPDRDFAASRLTLTVEGREGFVELRP